MLLYMYMHMRKYLYIYIYTEYVLYVLNHTSTHTHTNLFEKNSLLINHSQIAPSKNKIPPPLWAVNLMLGTRAIDNHVYCALSILKKTYFSKFLSYLVIFLLRQKLLHIGEFCLKLWVNESLRYSGWCAWLQPCSKEVQTPVVLLPSLSD